MAKTNDSAPAGMDKAEMRKHIAIARRAPMHIAFALGSDGKPIVMMDKRKQPRAIEKSLKDQASDSKGHRFGTLTFAADEPSVARIVVNKPASGMARKLIVALKGTGVRQIELVLEDGTAVESAQGDDDENEEDAGQAADAQPHHRRPVIHFPSRTEIDATRAAADDAETAQDDTEQDAGEQDAGEQDATSQNENAQNADATPDAATLKADLTGLVKRMMQVIAADPSQKAGLAELATDAQASLKRGDLVQASAGLDIMRQALDAASNTDPASDEADSTPDAEANDDSENGRDEAEQDSAGTDAYVDTQASKPAAAPVGKQAVQRYRKSRVIWQATRAKVDADIKKLSKTILAMDHGDAFGDALEQNFLSAIDPVLSTLDDSLAGILSDAENAADAEEVTRHLDRARTTIGLYQQFVSDNDTIKQLDSNPFMDLSVAKTLDASLSVLAAAMH